MLGEVGGLDPLKICRRGKSMFRPPKNVTPFYDIISSGYSAFIALTLVTGVRKDITHVRTSGFSNPQSFSYRDITEAA